MFAIVRTGGKQYRVSPGDKIVVEKLDGNAGDSITLSDVLLAGDGGDLKGTNGLTVGAEIVAQAKAEKVIVFKKRRRHNYRRKKGHRQQHTILKIVSIGGEQAKKAAPKQAAAAADTAPTADNETPAAPKKAKAKAPTSEGVAPADAGTTATTEVDASTQNAAPAKARAKKTPKA